MKVVIVGAGEVGFHIARRLAIENRDVVLVDKDFEALRRKALGSDLHISQKNIFLYSFQKFTGLFVLSRFQTYPMARLADT